MVELGGWAPHVLMFVAFRIRACRPRGSSGGEGGFVCVRRRIPSQYVRGAPLAGGCVAIVLVGGGGRGGAHGSSVDGLGDRAAVSRRSRSGAGRLGGFLCGRRVAVTGHFGSGGGGLARALLKSRSFRRVSITFSRYGAGRGRAAQARSEYSQGYYRSICRT